jgi:hypothetical protein
MDVLIEPKSNEKGGCRLYIHTRSGFLIKSSYKRFVNPLNAIAAQPAVV